VRIEADKPDHFMLQMQPAYAAVGRAWNIVRNSIGLYSEAEVKRARDFLRDLGKACRSEGRPPGDKPRADENRRMLDVFAQLASGKSLKQIAIDTQGLKDYENVMRSLSVLAERFSEKVYAAVRTQYGSVSEGFLRHEDSWGRLSSFLGSIKGWPGVKSNSRADGYALCEALRRHTPAETDAAKAKSRAFGVTNYPVQISPKSSP